MCGIACIFGSLENTVIGQLRACLQRRGPDVGSEARYSVGSGDATVLLLGHVLHLRGREVQTQPAVDSSGNLLLWNGEVFGGVDVPPSDSDTSIILRLLESGTGPSLGHRIVSALSAVRGPWAFVYCAEGRVFFARDRLGRRSLVQRFSGNDSGGPVVIASIAVPNVCGDDVDWEEVPTTGVFEVVWNSSSAFEVCHHPWPIPLPNLLPLPLQVPRDGAEMLARAGVANTSPITRAALALVALLDSAVRKRVVGVPRREGDGYSARVGVLFSGGLDCTVLAALAHRTIPAHEPIDLLSVCFDHPHHCSPDRHTAILSATELAHAYPSRKWRLLCVDSCVEEQVNVTTQPFFCPRCRVVISQCS